MNFLLLAAFLAAPAPAARTLSRFNAAVATALNPRFNYHDPLLTEISRIGGEDLIDPLAEAIEASGISIEDFTAKDAEAKARFMESKVPDALTFVRERAGERSERARIALTEPGADLRTMHDDVNRFLTLYRPYIKNSWAYQKLAAARLDLWRAVQASLLEGADATGAKLAAETATADTAAVPPDTVPVPLPHGLYIEDIKKGMTDVFEIRMTEDSVKKFAEISGDNQFVHMIEALAAQTRFKGRIVHGMLSASPISAALGTKLPGQGAIYLKQWLEFKKPVRLGDVVRAEVTVTKVLRGRRRVYLRTVVKVGDEIVIEGGALVLVDRRLALALPPAAAE